MLLKMKSNKGILPLIIMVLFALACSAVLPPYPFRALSPTPVPVPTATRSATVLPTQTIMPTLPPAYPDAEPLPLWMTDFADPILAAVADRRPDFQDDFSIHRGWLNVMTGSEPVLAKRYDGMLFLNLPERTKDSIFYNPKLNRKNFVLTLDLRFYHDQPYDTIRFQFDGGTNQAVRLDLSNNRNWKFQWGDPGNPQFASGIHEHFPPEHIPVTVIMRGSQCAVYLNNDPLVYSDACGIGQSNWSASFHLIRDTGEAVVINLDNLKLWDLDKIPNLP